MPDGVNSDSVRPGPTFGTRLRQARLAARRGAGLSQQELAGLLGLSQAAVSDYERDRRRPNMDLLVDIARHLAIDLDWLIRGDGRAPAPAAPDETPPARSSGGSPPFTPDLLRANLGQLLGIAALPSHGRVGLLDAGVVRWAEPGAAGGGAARAAEDRAGYGREAASAGNGGGLPADGPLMLDRALAFGAEAVAEYAGPPAGAFLPGDFLLVAYAEGYPGIRVLRPPAAPMAPGTATMVVEPPSVARTVAAGPRVVALLRRL